MLVINNIFGRPFLNFLLIYWFCYLAYLKLRRPLEAGAWNACAGPVYNALSIFEFIVSFYWCNLSITQISIYTTWIIAVSGKHGRIFSECLLNRIYIFAVSLTVPHNASSNNSTELHLLHLRVWYTSDTHWHIYVMLLSIIRTGTLHVQTITITYLYIYEQAVAGIKWISCTL